MCPPIDAPITSIPVHTRSAIPARAWSDAVAHLQVTRPGPALLRTALCMAGVSIFLALAWRSGAGGSIPAAFLLLHVPAGLFYAAMFMGTHDALHRTYSGWAWFDEAFGRLVSWPVWWTHATYAEVHKLHHGMNATDLADPERVEWTTTEYEQAGPLARWYCRNMWWVDMFVFGGFGMIWRTVTDGLRFRHVPAVRRALFQDITGILVLNGAIYALMIAHGVGFKYLAGYLVLERVVGMVQQLRSHIEHYGVWGRRTNYYETQVYGCRNIRTNRFASWYFNGLNFHSVHHAFVKVPFHNLRAAHGALTAVAESYGQPLIEASGYLRTTLTLARNPALIDSDSPLRQVPAR